MQLTFDCSLTSTHLWLDDGLNLDQNCIITEDVKSCIYCCNFRCAKLPERLFRKLKTGAIYDHTQSGLSN